MQCYYPRKLLVTGGAGFIGSNFIHYYQKNYAQAFIVNLDKLSYAACLENLCDLPYPKQHQFIKGDILDRKLVDRLLRKFDIDTIVHFAAESHVDRSIQDPAIFINTNIVGTFTLLESSRKFWLEEKKYGEKECRFHHISTDEVYGSLGKNESAFTEISPYAPSSPYSSSKAASDHLVKAYYRTYGLPISMTNCSNNFGPFQHREKFIPKVVQCCINQKMIPVYGDGSNIRDWLYVDDHCQAIDYVVRKGKVGQTYNVGGNAEISNLQVVNYICETLEKISPTFHNSKRLIRFVEDRIGHDWRYAINSKKIKQTLSWQAQESFFTGLFKTLSFAMKQLQPAVRKVKVRACSHLGENFNA